MNKLRKTKYLFQNLIIGMLLSLKIICKKLLNERRDCLDFYLTFLFVHLLFEQMNVLSIFTFVFINFTWQYQLDENISFSKTFVFETFVSAISGIQNINSYYAITKYSFTSMKMFKNFEVQQTSQTVYQI